MASRTTERRCKGGPMHGWPVRYARVSGSQIWLDGDGRCHAAPAEGRALYRIDGDVLRFVGHAARRCGGCGVTIDPDPSTGESLPSCPLCGSSE